jgi:hypothetical protein
MVMNEYQNVPYGMEQQYAPQGFFGGLLGAPLGGLIGRGIGGLLGNPNLGRQIGQTAGGIGGAFLPFGTDPVQQAQLQQQIQQEQLQQLQQAQLAQQLNPQGWFGNLIGQVGRPLGSMLGTTFGNPNLGATIGGIAGQVGRMLPFGADPVQQAQLQQQIQMEQLQQAQLAQQLNPQGWFGNLISQVGRPLGGAIGGAFGNAGLGSAIGGLAGQIGRVLPFDVDPQSLMAQPIGGMFGYQQLLQRIQQLQQQLAQVQQQNAQLAQSVQQQPQVGAQQGQIAPQGWFGNLIGQVGQPLGSAIGGLFGNSQLGSTIGGVAGGIGRMHLAATLCRKLTLSKPN